MLTMKSTADQWAAFRAGFRSSRNLYPFSVSPFSRSGGVMGDFETLSFLERTVSKRGALVGPYHDTAVMYGQAIR
jgi:hypothetical protein